MTNLIVEIDSDIMIVKLNRPEVYNALNLELVSELSMIFNTVLNEDNIKAVILTGIGNKAFCAGGDLNMVIDMTPIQAEKYAYQVHNLLNTIENFEKPVIAAINGYALGGGCQLALACDLRIASSNAKLGQPEVTIGIPPGWGGSQRLARIIGISKAKELIFTGKIISAEEAKKINLLNTVIYLDNKKQIQNAEIKSENPKVDDLLSLKLLKESVKIAKTITINDAFAIKIIKSLINKSRDVNIDSGLTLERFGNLLCLTSNDKHKIRNLLAE
jgi:3-hydroxypropionyl-coenzyme A dehydratase